MIANPTLQARTNRMSKRLAIIGGRPAFRELRQVGKPNVGNRKLLMQRINDMLDTRWLSNNGRYLREFEQRIAGMLGVSHCVAVCNATIGLELAVRATGLSGEVIVPSFTFAATAQALEWQGITPVFADVDPLTHTLDPVDVERRITPRTTGILGVHLWGRACDIDGLNRVAKRYNLKLLFDGAHAFGCSHKGQMIGNFGEAEVFSFHATKFCNSFEGGAIVTNNNQLAAKLRAMKNFGMSGQEDIGCAGTNAKMSEVAAAMGLTSLESLDEFIAINRENYLVYQRHLEGLPGVKMVKFDNTESANYQYIVLEIEEQKAGLSRDQLIEVLQAENVSAKRYFYPGCHRLEIFATQPRNRQLRLPVTERLSNQTLALPTGTAVTARDAAKIAEVIGSALVQAVEVRRALAKVGTVMGTAEPAGFGNWNWHGQYTSAALGLLSAAPIIL